MANVMLLGDVHGDRGFTRGAIIWAAASDVDYIVQVGDFGFWPRTNNGQRFLHDVGKQSAESGVPFYWLDGNHEDHLALDKHVAANTKPDQFYVNYGKYPLRYLPRGTTWEWGGVRFGAFGGAFSIDRNQRIEDSGSYGWFRGEVPDASKIPDLGKLDVLLTHDSPIVPPCMFGGGFKRDANSSACQKTVYDALVATEATLLVHGHWHVNERYGVHKAVVQGLDMNQSSLYAAAVVFRTDDRRLFKIREWEYRDDNRTD